MRTCSLFAAIVTCVVAGSGAGAQAATSRQGAITGRVTDQSTGLPVPSAAGVVTGTTIGALTNDSGVFTMPAMPAGTPHRRWCRDGYGLAVRSVGSPAAHPWTLAFAIYAL